MTAFCCLVGTKDVRLLTDGLTVNFYTGADAPPMTKVVRFDRFPGALTLRGALTILDWFEEKLAPAASFDEAVTFLEQAIAERQQGGGSPSYQLVFAGWSRETAAPRAFFVSGVAAGMYEAMKLHPIDRLMTIPPLPTPETRAFLRSKDPENDFPTLMDRIVEGDRTGMIGAFCELTIVTEHGAASDVVREYGAPRPLDRRQIRGVADTLPDVFKRALGFRHFSNQKELLPDFVARALGERP